MFTANLAMEKAFQFSRFDLSNPLSTCSAHPILLDDENWLTCEHYVQAKTLRSAQHAQKVASLPTGEKAYALEVPGYAMLLKPLDSGQLISMVSAGACPEEDIEANWVIVKMREGADGR